MKTETYDILIAGASTTGAWFAREMAKRGHKVLVIEKQKAKDVSREYDIFHMEKYEMQKFGIELPEENDVEYGFEFGSTGGKSPYGNYEKVGVGNPIIGMHKHEQIMKMNKKAEEAGAKIIYGAAFTDFIRDEKGKIIGAKYKTARAEKEVYCKLVADCTGIPSAARRMLPDTSVVENKVLDPKNIFYVVLYYIKYKDKNVDPMKLHTFFLNYKAWSAPSGDPNGAILGVGGNYCYEYAEEIFKDFRKNVPWPEYTVEKIEKGMTPYYRSLYSFVDDNFIAMGDTAQLTKPTCGEGCSSSLYQARIAVDVISRLLEQGKELTKENMWPINKKYMTVQGKDFDALRPILIGIVGCTYDEAEYMFKTDTLFSQKILGGGGNDLDITPADVINILKNLTIGVATGKLRGQYIKEIIKGLTQFIKVAALYDAYPVTPDGFDEWKKKADALWNEIGSMGDTCNKDILSKLNKI